MSATRRSASPPSERAERKNAWRRVRRMVAKERGRIEAGEQHLDFDTPDEDEGEQQ